ncbi:MAG TPA: MarR family transcriptional regulator [Kofleriaceae bacterium]
MKSRPDDSAAAALVALRKVVRGLRLADREVENATGVSVAQLFVMHQLAAEPGLSIAELAERVFTDQSSVSTVVARLVERKLVTRKQAREDRRRVELRLTPRGQKLVDTAPSVPQERLIETIRSMTPARRAEVVRGLEALAQAIGATAVQPRMLFEDEPAPAKRRRQRD